MGQFSQWWYLSAQVTFTYDGALLSWRWRNTSLPRGSGKQIPCSPLLAWAAWAFALSIKLPLSRLRSFPTFTPSVLSPIPLVGSDSCMVLSHQLGLNHNICPFQHFEKSGVLIRMESRIFKMFHKNEISSRALDCPTYVPPETSHSFWLLENSQWTSISTRGKLLTKRRLCVDARNRTDFGTSWVYLRNWNTVKLLISKELYKWTEMRQ